MGKPQRKCVICKLVGDTSVIFGYQGQKYCKEHLRTAKGLHRKFTNPYHHYGAKTGG